MTRCSLLPAAAGLLLVAVAGGLLPLPAAARNGYSSMWGRRGELWDPKGGLPDFSFAGYRQGAARLPTPRVTKSVLDFKGPGVTDTEMIVAAVNWAHSQPVPTDGGYTVLHLPAGTYTLTERLWFKRSRIVFRGDGAGKTILNIPKSLWDIYGPNPANPATGGYVNNDGFMSIVGNNKRGTLLGKVISGTKGDYTIKVSGASRLRVGGMYDLWWTDINGRLNREQFDGKMSAPSNYIGSTRIRFTVKVLGISGSAVTIERPLPYTISSSIAEVEIFRPGTTVEEVGIEGLTFKFKWEYYAGHHLERGWNGIDLTTGVRNCWVRDVEFINPDTSIMTNWGAAAITVTGIQISFTRTRANNIPNKFKEATDADAHWGVVYSGGWDFLCKNFTFRGKFMHDVGTGMGGKWGVFADGRLTDGNLDLHRGLAGPTLYTNIDVGRGTNALSSGGPARGGANSVAYSTWWNIRSDQPVDPNGSNTAKPGECSYGTSINLVGVNLNEKGYTMCPSWHFERVVNRPANIYDAQLERRLAAGRR